MLSFLWGSARDTVGGGIAAATVLKSRDLHTSVSRSSVKQTLQSDAQKKYLYLYLYLFILQNDHITIPDQPPRDRVKACQSVSTDLYSPLERVKACRADIGLLLTLGRFC